jgi:hypothetical protein
MSVQITTAMVKTYSSTVSYLASQETSRLRPFFSVEPIHGEEVFFEQVGSVDMKDVTTRHTDTEYTDTPHSRRRVNPITSQIADLVDRADRVKINIAPEGAYTRRHAEAWGRRLDDHIIDAAFGTAYTGKAGTTSTSFPAGNVVAHNFATTTSLTLAKVAEANRLLDSGEVPREDRVAVIGSKQVADLMEVGTATSGDYVSLRPLMDGQIAYWMGFNWVRSERLNTTAAGYRRTIFAHRDGIRLGIAEDMFASVDVLPTKKFSTQVYLEGIAGAARMEEARVVEVQCVE